ncbi:MAG: NupC/NupG family nucleoside CNT transporter [Elusimicrobia bacterium]|nr:MAG: NupC/NupG family nucleoside CNT transporter [Elusimicrobiota bacterium]
MEDFIRAIIGVASLIGFGVLISSNRKKIKWETVAWGLGLQIVFGLFLLKTPWGLALFSKANDTVIALLGFSNEGAKFLFGPLIGFSSLPVAASDGSVIGAASIGMIFAFRVLPTILFFSALMSIMYYLGVMQVIISVFAKLMSKTMKTSGAESLSVAANIFVGQTEAPLVVKPYINDMTKSELTAIMAGGFATVAGGVMAAYVGFLKDSIPNIAGHLMTASIMSAPAALAMAKIIYPETEKSKTAGTVKLAVPQNDANLVDAAANGTIQGLQLALNVGAMLIAFIALVAMLDGFLGWASLSLGAPPENMLTLKKIFGVVLWPVAWLLGVPSIDAGAFANLLGTKLMINEFVAYVELGEAAKTFVHTKSAIIGSYALCGFANVSSIGIQLGGIGAIAEGRRGDLARVAWRALAAGACASFMTAALAGFLV